MDYMFFTDKNGNYCRLIQDIDSNDDVTISIAIANLNIESTPVLHIDHNCSVFNKDKELIGKMGMVGMDHTRWGFYKLTNKELQDTPIWDAKCNYPYAGELAMTKSLLEQGIIKSY